MISLNCNGTYLYSSTPIVMGILNLTPDSFYSGSRYSGVDAALRQAETMLQNGATILDIGGVSTRPNASTVSKAEELDRVLPAIVAIKKRFDAAIISIDTFRAEVAHAAVQEGATVVNDVSGGRFDADLWRTVGALNVPYILMHSIADPQTMQNNPQYDDVLLSVMDYFIQTVPLLRESGIKDIIIDMGYGFGKTAVHNFELLKHQADFSTLGLPILTGISRKSMIYKTLAITPEIALPATAALHLYALQQGAAILRAHDVKEAMQVVELYKLLE